MKLISSKFSKEETVQKFELVITNRLILRVLAFMLGTFLSVVFFTRIAKPLTLIGASAFLALALNPAVVKISHKLKSKSRVKASAVAYLFVVISLGAFFSLVVPPLVNQTTEFIKDAPQKVNELRNENSGLGKVIKRYKLEGEVSKIETELRSKASNFTGPVFATAGKIGNTIVSILTVLVLTFMMLTEGPRWVSLLWSLHPDGEEETRRRFMFQRMNKVITGYVNGQLLIAVIAGLFALIAMLLASTILNVDVNAIALSGIIVLFGLIPMFGNFLGAVIVVFICLISSVPLAVTMGIFFLVYQQIENVTLQPYIQSKTNDLTPLLVFVAALLGVSFGGVMGAFIAIPAMGCARIFVEDYLQRKGFAVDKAIRTVPEN
jgi:predicted PurR-regulated permease PerM